MEPSFKTNNPYIQFLFAEEPAKFLVDTNLTLRQPSGNIFIALAYPKLIVEVCGQGGVEKTVINCQQPEFHVDPDEYPLYDFLSLYPLFAEQIVRSHPVIEALFHQYMEQQWDKLLGTECSQEFLDKEAHRIHCTYYLPEIK
ncbi:hypothetical protein [Burkholderia multivorans]|uniref:hypothetical protein n=1 Tax=Burkholderia multivorans TaxID=87883 RepID=UPI0011B1E538|nr:hypothetical protein [Burkholderia multivorans]